jgi:hypothetical protein
MIFGVIGTGARSGKTTAANAIPGNIVPFASTLKRMLEVLLYDLGISSERIHGYLYGNTKHEIIPEIGCTARHLMQTLGTEWGRRCVRDDLWLHVWSAKADRSDEDVVVDDVRFPNEVALLKSKGASIIKVVGAEDKNASNHESEGQQLETDIVIHNDGTIAELQNNIRKAIHDPTNS